MDGTYNIALHTPVGFQKGTVSFISENGILKGSIRAMGHTSYFKNGKKKGHSFEFSGILNAGFFSTRYKAKGSVDGEILNAVAMTNLGTYQINGKRLV